MEPLLQAEKERLLKSKTLGIMNSPNVPTSHENTTSANMVEQNMLYEFEYFTHTASNRTTNLKEISYRTLKLHWKKKRSLSCTTFQCLVRSIYPWCSKAIKYCE